MAVARSVAAHGRWGSVRRELRWPVEGLVLLALACAPGGLADENKLPPEIQDPATLRTPSGAIARYQGALAVLPEAFDWLLTQGAIFTDELTALPTPLSVVSAYTGLDSREDLSTFTSDYNRLHRLRAQAREARGFLAAYAPDASPALRGHLYAVEGYAEIFLADLFCSGIPLSTVDFDGDYTLAPGSTTTEVYRHAVALFDTALTLAADSLRVQYFAAVGRARALLALEDYGAAAAAAAGVPDDFRYQVLFDPPVANGVTQRLLQQFAQDYTSHSGTPGMGDQEGITGLDYRTSGDPRTVAVDLGTDLLGHEMYFPAKYPTSGAVTLTVADGIEARLVESEAALQGGSSEWLAKLNALRTDGTYDTQPDANDPNQTDTLWHAGSGGVAGLRPLEDPGNAAARVDLLFRERAFWLYLTGHRQGDLRRLIRQYGRSPSAVYPTGVYQGGGGVYGTEVVLPVPASEQELNPRYTGCINRGA